jgi:hypothetical protein
MPSRRSPIRGTHGSDFPHHMLELDRGRAGM